MTIPDIRDAVEALLGEPLSTKRIKEALSAGTLGGSPRFRRVRRGAYEVMAPRAGVRLRRRDARAGRVTVAGLSSYKRLR
jgi:hypothetical protein